MAFELFPRRMIVGPQEAAAEPRLSFPAFQPVRRDFAFVAAAELAAETLLRAVRGAERSLIAGVMLFDVYEGAALGPGQKSLGVEVTMQPREKTLTDGEIEAVSAKIVQAAGKVGARLR